MSLKTLDQLPDNIFDVLVQYVTISDRIAFARVNASICGYLMKRVREIELLDRKALNFFFNEEFRLKVLNLIQSPSSQLSFNSCIKHEEIFDFYEYEPLIARSFSTTIELFKDGGFWQYLRQVPKLTLEDLNNIDDSDDSDLYDSEPDSSDGWTPWSFDLDELENVKTLELSSMNIECLPKLKNLTSISFISCLFSLYSLNLKEFSQLKQVKLEACDMIFDVSCLDTIYDLTIERCHLINDISCLNHNYSIAITDCAGIVDYSNSFQFSRNVKIFSSYPRSINLGIKMNNLMKLESLSVVGVVFQLETDGSIPSVASENFRSLTVDSVRLPFSLPNGCALHSLRILYCSEFQLSSEISNIRVVYLNCLPVTSLHAFGPGNISVTVDKCKKVTDFSPLSRCRKVAIKNCPGFIDSRPLKGVPELIVETDFKIPMLSFEGITDLHLTLKSINSLATSMKLSKKATSVKSIYLELNFGGTHKEIRLSLRSLFSMVWIERVVMVGSICVTRLGWAEMFRSDEAFYAQLCNSFHGESRYKEQSIVFIRK